MIQKTITTHWLTHLLFSFLGAGSLWLGLNQMPSLRKPAIAQTQTLAASPILPAHNPVAPTSQARIRVVEADAQGVVVELNTGELAVETIEQDGVTFQRLTVADTALTDTPGAPQLPMRSTLLGTPTTTGLVLTVLTTEQETRRSGRIYPAPRLTIHNGNSPDQDNLTNATVEEVFTLDSTRYQIDANYPGALATLGETGYMRDQAVVRINFYPVQYNPVRGEIQFYRRIRVRLTWAAPVQAAATGSTVSVITPNNNPVYEALLRASLLNYAALGRSAVDRPVAAHASFRANPEMGEQKQAQAEAQLKLGVQTDGIYRITYNDLVTANFNPESLDPRTLQMTNRGQPVAIDVVGEEDGRFDVNDQILFYGVAIHADIYTTTNVYWLSAARTSARRMAIRNGAPTAGAPSPSRFRTTVHAEKDTVYWSNMLNAENGEDHWFWERRITLNTVGFPAARSYPVSAPSPATDVVENATLRIRLKGYTSTGHRAQVIWNEQLLSPPVVWEGRVEYTYTATIPHTWLKDGENKVEVKVIADDAGPTTGAPDAILVNWLELDYWRAYRTANDTLAFRTDQSGLQQFQLSGFSTATLTILDITNMQTPVRILTSAPQAENGRFRFTLQEDALPTQQYLAISERGYQKPVYLVRDEPSSLKTLTAGVNYVIITHPDFYASATLLADYRRQQSGFTVLTAKIDDIYDEFNFGIANPKAIRDFLTHLYMTARSANAPTPDYVLLLGDATVDYRGNLTPATPNFVPTQIISSTLFGEVASDNWFVRIQGDDILPEMYIGRLAAQTSTEAERMVTRIINYDKFPPTDPPTDPPTPSWNRQVLFVADEDESKFADNSDELATTHPFYGYTITKVYLRDYLAQPIATPRQQIINKINAGAILVNYYGHGEHFGWGTSAEVGNPDQYIFHNKNVAELNNKDMLPVFTIANCLNGAFAGTTDRPALAEELQRALNGGAIAVWAPSSLGFPTGHKELLGSFYDAIFLNDQTHLGEAATTAKLVAYGRSTRWAELVQTYILFGDPATKLGIPVNPPYILQTNPSPGSTEVAIDQNVTVRFSKPVTVTPTALTSSDGKVFPLLESRDDRTFVFANPGLAYATRYTLTVKAEDRLGNNLRSDGPAPNPWSFTTGPDLRPRATLQLLSPLPGVARPGDQIRITFTEPVLPSSLVYNLTPAVEGQFIWSEDGKQAIFAHENFVAGQIYTFTLKDAKDVTNNSLAEPPAPLIFGVVKQIVASYLPLMAR